jgi:class 3 adenylate cyclase
MGREIRRLRFEDPALERAFREDYARQSLLLLRLVFWFTLLAQVPLAILSITLYHWSVTEPRFWARTVSGCAVSLLGLLLTRSPRYVRWIEAYMVFASLFIGGTLVIVFVPTPLGWVRLTSFLVAACIIFRQRTRAAILVVLSLIAWYAGFSLGILHRPASVLGQGLPTLGFTALWLVFGVYLMEHAMRRDFILSRLLAQERAKSEQLLLNILPGPVADRLKEKPGTLADSFAEVTVLFADIVDFTPLSAQLSAEGTVELLNEVFSCFDRLAEQHGLEKIKTIGDAYMVVGGLPEARADHAAAVIAMSLDMQQETARFRRQTGEPLRLRIGINTGPVVAGVIGTKKFSYDLWGDTVNIASRMESHGLASTIQVTEATYERVRDQYRFEARRLADVKGKGEMTTYLLVGREETGTSPLVR